MPKSERRSFQYQARTKEDVKERANMKGGNFDTIFLPKYKVYKVKEGKNIIRVLPPTWPKARHYGYDIWVNYGIGVDNQSYLSLSKMKNEPDPLAEGRRDAEREGDEKLAKALQPRQRILMWVIDRLAEDEGPQLWPAAFTLDKDLATMARDEDTGEVIFIDDPEGGDSENGGGCDVRFYKEGQGLKTKYDPLKIKLLKSTPLHEDEGLVQEWLQYVQDNPLPDCLQFYDYEHISTVFNGQARVEEDDNPEPKKPSRKVTPDEDDDNEKVEPRGARSRLNDEKAGKRAQPNRADPDDEDAEASEETPQKGSGQSIRERLAARRSAVSSKRPAADEDD